MVLLHEEMMNLKILFDPLSTNMFWDTQSLRETWDQKITKSIKCIEVNFKGAYVKNPESKVLCALPPSHINDIIINIDIDIGIDIDTRLWIEHLFPLRLNEEANAVLVSKL